MGGVGGGGGEGEGICIGVIWMVVREPGLLAADPQQLMKRLMQRKVRLEVVVPQFVMCQGRKFQRAVPQAVS